MRVECPKCKRVYWVNSKDVKESGSDYIFRCRDCDENIVIPAQARDQDTSIGALRVKKDFVGSLEVIGVPDVIQMCHLGLKTGRLQLSSPRGKTFIYFKEGNISYAVPATEREGIGYYLFKNGRIDLTELSKIVKTSQSESVSQEKAVLDVLSWNDAELQIAFSNFATETVINTFPWSSGEFAFTEAASPKDAPTELVADTTELILEGSRLIKEWDLIRRTISDDSVVLQVRGEATKKLERTHLPGDEREVLALIDGKRTVGEICHEAPCSEFIACRSMYSFLAAGLVRKVNIREETKEREKTGPQQRAAGTRSRLLRREGGQVTQVIPVGNRTIVFGRSLSADVYVGNDRASRRHCQIMSRGGKLIVRDLGSTNGTFLNGRRVIRETLAPGDVVSVGDSEFVVEG